MKPATVYMTARAQEDLEELDLAENGHLEQGGPVLGYLDTTRDRVVVAQLRKNPYVQPYSAVEFMIGGDALATFDTRVDGLRTIGIWHTHVYVQDPPRCSDGDKEVWRRQAEDLAEPAYVGLVVGPREVWESGYPGGCSWEDPQVSAWLVSPGGQIRTATIMREPDWLADLRQSVRFRPERSTNG
jgi:hypothetical protein